MAAAPCSLRRLRAEDDEDIALVAQRMRLTLIEVLGEQEGGGLYTQAWLIDRVRAHLDPARLDGSAWIAAAPDGFPVGHLLARSEPAEGRAIGLIATVYVTPEWRRRGVAAQLFDTGERWLRARGHEETAYDTAENHHAMIALLHARGYEISFRAPERAMLRMTRRY